ncbi:hypothetical protein [Microbacterium sp.]|uniref:hypothetical protein n=1 Tax=Microbacterium sp. TaxID=51671 RepID=UPI003F71EED0
MNRYAAQGIASDATQGRRVLVVTAHARARREAFDEIARLTHGAESIRRLNGAESIRHSNGGRVEFATERSRSHRGLSVDVVYLDGGVADSLETVNEFTPCLATSRDAELIKA